MHLVSQKCFGHKKVGHIHSIIDRNIFDRYHLFYNSSWTAPDCMDPCLVGPVDARLTALCCLYNSYFLKELHQEKKELSSVICQKKFGQSILNLSYPMLPLCFRH